MKRRFTILAAAFTLLAFLAIPMGMRGQTRDVETFTFSELGYSNGDDVTTVEGDNVTLTFDQGTNANNAPKYYNTGSGVRMYTGNTLEVALNDQTSDTRITAIDFTFSGTYTGSLQNWTGSETSVSFTNTASGQARIQVIAVTFSEGGTPTPTTYTVTYDCNGGTSGCPENVTGITAGTNITLANAPTKDGFDFAGWNNGNDTYNAGDPYIVNGNVTFTAQWTEQSSGDEQWVLTNLADLTASDVFVIVGNGYAMTNNNGTSSAPAPVAVTISGNEITSNVSSTIKWTVSGDAINGYSFSPNGSTDTWLYCNTNANTSSNNNMRVGDGGQYNRIVFELTSENYLVTKDDYADRYLSHYFNNGAVQDWRGYVNNNSAVAISFYKKVTGGVLPPSISADNVSIEYNAVSGSIAYTINNSVTGGTMSAAVTDGDWLTLGSGTTSPISFTCTANEGATERTATVTLTYTYNRATATANVTVTQAGNPNIVDNISDITSDGTYAVKGTIVAINNRGFILGDGTGYVYYFYGASGFEPGDYDIGDMVKLTGSVVDYGGVFEFNNTTEITYVSESNYVEEDPTVLSGAEMDARVASTTPQLSSYVQYEGTLTVSGNYYNITNIAGATTAKGSISYPLNGEEIAALNGKQVIVTGYYVGVSSSQYYNTMIGSVVESTEPAVILAPDAVNVSADGGLCGFAVSLENIPASGLPGVAVWFYDAQPEWIPSEGINYHNFSVNPIQMDSLYLTILPNTTTESRSVGIKLAVNGISSNLVTITQEGAPTYAELPFEFNSGKAAIEETDGLYQDGLGSDYNTDNTKLKFDHTGDWLLLQFNERPGVLTFNIKNNGFSGGTFTVQTSEDGVTYTDLAVYTEISGTQDEEFNNLGENVRYIKWVYTEKVNGNVGLGNIVLDEYIEPEPAILLNEYMIEMAAEGGEGTIGVTYQNIDVGSYSLGVEFYTEEGETPTAYDWIIAEIDANNNVHYVVEANQGDARTAYFKVFYDEGAMGGDWEDMKDEGSPWMGGETYYSDMVTVSQAAYVPPFEPATYTLVTSSNQLIDGKTYIIVGSKEIEGETNYYAMGEQRNSNRGGVAISVDGTTATVETAEVHEFVVTVSYDDYNDLKTLKDGSVFDTFLSFYDANEASQGYLYAASNTGNQLKTETVLDANGVWGAGINGENAQFTLVAQGDNSHNVMQFNYNNNNPTLFNCYTSDSQSPVYLYVKDETPSIVTQTIALSAGWNWVSFNKEITLNDLKAALLEAAPAGTGIMIKSKDKTTEYKPATGRWSGRLTALDLSQMYLIQVAGDCAISLQGLPVDPADHPVTVLGGGQYTYIAFPLEESMSLTNAFAGFAVQNDKVKAKSSNAEYQRRWQGQLTTLEPGAGYMYMSAPTAADRPGFVFPYGTSKAAVAPTTVQQP